MLVWRRTVQAAPSEKPLASDHELLAQARQRIEKHRRADGTIVVRGTGGRPVAGATVQIEQASHEFLFGCNFFRFARLSDPQLEGDYRARFAALLNYATLPFYWAMYEPQRGQPIYDYTDLALDWCRQQGIRCKGHPLVWDHRASTPRWLPRDFAEIRRLSDDRVRACVARFKGRLDTWDVVNEPTHLGRFGTRTGEWAQSMGPVPYTAEALRVARAANPEATLLVNDYRTDPPYHAILEALRDEGKLLFDAVGIQSHMHGGGWPLARIWDVCDRFGRLRLPIHFTETTIVSGPRTGPGENWGATTPELEEKQADFVTKFYTMLFGHPSVQALTWWDFSDNGAWQRAAAGFLRTDMSPKPVYDRLQGLIKGEWWTKAEGLTNAAGELATRAFCGSHRVTARRPGGQPCTREVRFERDQPNRFELNVT